MTVGDRVSAYRGRLRARGLRPLQIWVPDVRSDAFIAEAHRQSRAVAESPTAEADQTWVESVAIEWDE